MSILVRPTLWHQEQIMAAARQAIRSADRMPCACGQPATVFDVDLCRWLCAPCAAADFAALRAAIIPTERKEMADYVRAIRF